MCRACGATRIDQQIGLEPTPDQWVQRLVDVFREVRRVLRDDGTLWLEVGDSYAGGGGYSPGSPSNVARQDALANGNDRDGAFVVRGEHNYEARQRSQKSLGGLKPKDLVGAPWLLAFALRNDGWYLRSDTIWARPNPMPESVTDRPTKSHSYIFLLTKRPRYYYDADAIREDFGYRDAGNGGNRAVFRGGYDGKVSQPSSDVRNVARTDDSERHAAGRNARSVWTIPNPNELVRLRSDLSADDRRRVLAALAERGCVDGS